jgi:hypothetical protein
MTPMRPLPANTGANADRRDRTRPSSALQARARLMADGVVASYIREISVRTVARDRAQVAA